MFYEILDALLKGAAEETFFRVFGFTTVRAACALVFALGVSLLLGPACIRWLAALRIGQQVRHFTTGETRRFNIHDHKAGTPTMGGLLIIVATLSAAILFCDPRNSYVWLVIAVMIGAGALGFVDDYLKVARKNHRGVSAKTKLLVQAALGCALGAFLLWSRPHTLYGSVLLKASDIRDPAALATAIGEARQPFEQFLRLKMSMETNLVLDEFANGAVTDQELQTALVRELNPLLKEERFYQPDRFENIALKPEAREHIEKHHNRPNVPGSMWLNRLLLESAFPEAIAPTRIIRSDSHLLVPFFKNAYPSLGFLLILWGALVLTASSNAVNLTDGLDGLAIGTVVTVSLPFLVIAYLASRFDYAGYLYIPHVPQAGELSVFLSALLGASMGFFWFNSHPAEVFMGDTGSLSLGAVIGAIAVLCKHELLLVLIGGIFVVEALSVVIQVASYKWLGKRVLLMSPLHNHYVKKGMNEAKIIARFLIVALLLALVGLSTLKLR